jgi:signal transduction histidine kinase
MDETITADERKLKQILYNLISNSLKCTPDGGQVYLSIHMVNCVDPCTLPGKKMEENGIIHNATEDNRITKRVDKVCVQFSVRDTGIGVKKEDQERIFSPFEQANASGNRKFQGTGLGLSLTKRLVELHGGRIWVESDGINKGATFSFTLPIE